MAGFRTYLRFYKAVLAAALPVLLCGTAPVRAEEELCMDGTLLFREDFGGNDPNDPIVGTDKVPGMEYQQIFVLEPGGFSMDPGRYLVTKQGYRNSTINNYSLWHIMDDHTYPDDYTRGYFMEVDGKGGNDAFYTATLSGLCAGSTLTFSAYMANLETAGQFAKWKSEGMTSSNPAVSFVITDISDPETPKELARHDADSIGHDWSLLNTSGAWKVSAHWQLVGMNFTVPSGVDAVQLSIHNNVSAYTGNDFALDDIEVRLCLSASIEGEHMVCAGQEVTLQAESPDLRFMTAPAYKWWHSTDSLAWTESSATSASLTIPNTKTNDEGWYRVAIAGNENIDKENCRAMSEPFRLRVKDVCEEKEELCMDGTLLFREDFGGNDPNDPIVGTDKVPGMDYDNYTQQQNADHVTGQPGLFWLIKSGYYHADTTNGRDPMKNHSNWYLQDDHTYPNDKSRGYLLEIDGKGGKAPFYSTVISDLCPASRLTFSAYVANVNKASNYIDGQHARIYPRLRFELTDAETGAFLADHSTGDIPYDPDLTVNTDFWYSSKWYLHGMNFEVPPGVSSIRLTIYNDVENNGAGNDFALDDIEIRLCAPPVSIIGPDEVCHGEDLVLRTEFTNDGTFTSPQYLWYHSRDSINWYEIPLPFKDTLPLPNIQWGDSGWFKVAVASADRIRLPNCRSESKPFYLHVKDCPSDLCMDGTLLFREDFGGNSPDDPGRLYSLPEELVQSLKGCSYKILKQGTGNNIQWHKQDDHTYFGDFTRGYFAEIDGCDNSEPFFTKKIDNLCTGTKLTLSAYVTNLHHVGQLDYFKGNYVYPRVKFVFRDPETNQELASHATGDIRPDYSYLGRWTEARENLLSAEWQLVGMTFEIPEGMNSVQMEIYNDVRRNGNGNDFALDDIEIHICLPPVKIVSEPEACEDSPHTFKADFTNDGSFAEPLEYKWYFSADSLTWTELPEKTGTLTYAKCQKTEHEGWYRAAVADSENIDKENCRAMSEPFRLKVKDDCEPPKEELCMDGTLLFREDFGGNDPNDPRLVSTPADIQGMTYEQLLTDRFGTMKSGGFLITKEGYCNGDTSVTNPTRGSQWHLQDDHTYPGDKTRGYFLEIDGRGDHAAFYTRTIKEVCAGMRLTFSAYVANVMTWGMYVGSPGKYVYPRLKFVITDPNGKELKSYDTGDIPYDPGADSAYVKNWDLSAWQNSAEWHLVGMNFTVPENVDEVTLTIYNATEGNNGNDFALDDIEIRLCLPPVTIEGANEVCQDSELTLTAHFENDGTFLNPDYQWYFSTDSAGSYNEIDPAMALTYTIENAQKADEGWYRIGISERGQMAYMNCRAISEPFPLKVNRCAKPLCMDGTLLFREDFGGNDPNDPRIQVPPEGEKSTVPGMSDSYRQLMTDAYPSMGSGRYLVTKSGYCNGDTTGWTLPGADLSGQRSQWYIQDDHTYPDDYSRGYFLEIDGSGGSQQFYETEISGLCAGSELTFSAYVANVFAWFQYDWHTKYRGPVVAPGLKFVLTDPTNGTVLAAEEMPSIPFDESLPAKTDWQYSSTWHLVGMNFTVPTGVEAVRLSIYNNVNNGNGNDFAIDDIEVRLCVPPVKIVSEPEACEGSPHSLKADFTNDGSFAEPLEYKWYFSADSLTWSELPEGAASLTHTECRKTAHEGWYRVAVAGSENIDKENCRAMSEPFHLTVKECERENVTQTDEITVCEDELPYTWHGHEFTEAEEEYTYTEYTATQAITYIYTLHTKYCPPPCPETLVPIVEDSTICGYALPFVWHDAVFDRPSTQTVIEKNERGCDTFVYTLTVDTVHCVKRYPIIVNKYNWVLLVDNIAVRRLFPDKTPVAYQWYKDDEPIAGATEDDYSEQNELHGVFSMLLHFADGSSVWSNIIDLSQTPTAAPVRVKAYNSSGILVREWQATEEQGGLSLPPGIYLLRYEGGDEVFTEKRIVP